MTANGSLTPPGSKPQSTQDLSQLVPAYEFDPALLEALRLFEISSEIYQQALHALQAAEERTSANTGCGLIHAS